MKQKNLTILGATISVIIMFLIIVYAQLGPPAPFIGTVTVNDTAAAGAVVYAYNTSGGAETLCGESDPTFMIGEDAWFTELGCTGGVDETIKFKVKPAGEATQYDSGTTVTGSEDTQIVYLSVYTGSGSPPTTCEINAPDCTYCDSEGSGWKTKDSSHGDCSEPYEGCVLDREPDGIYDWACCGDTVRRISTF